MYDIIKIVANFGKLKFVEINGRQFAVAPIRILMPRVLNGSRGALYYPPEEIAKNVADWNGKPLVVKHPNLKGSNVSAHMPEIMATQEIGRIYNAKIDNDNGLRVDGYFDVELTRRVDARVWDALIKGEKIEVSTGLFTDNEDAKENANHEGTPYRYVARNYRPDHLAILPDEQGACSCQDGCGVYNEYEPQERLAIANWLVSNSKAPTINPDWVVDHDIWMKAKEQAAKEGHTDDYEYIAGIYKKMGGKVKSVSNTSNSQDNQMNWRNWIINFMANRCDCYKGNPTESKKKLEALTDNELKEIVLEAKDSIITNAAKEEDVNGEGKFFEWMMNADQDIRKAFVGMMKRKMIAQTGADGKPVVPNATPATPVPPVLTEEEKKKKEEEEEAKKKAAAQPAANNTMSTLSKEDQEALAEARKIVGNERTRLINQLTAHITDNTKKQTVIATLNTKSLDDLRERLELLPPVANQQTNNGQQTGNVPLPAYFGIEGNSGQTYNRSEVENDILDVPSHTY